MKLLCLIEGESIVFGVEVPRDSDVSDLKKVIKGERKYDTLKDVGPHTLEMWKVRVIVPCKSTDSPPRLLRSTSISTCWTKVPVASCKSGDVGEKS